MVLKPNDIIQIKVTNDLHDKTYLSRVEDVSENQVLIAAPIEEGSIVPLKLNSEVTINVTKEEPPHQGRFQAIGYIRKRDSASQVPVFLIELADEWRKIQKRDYVRVDVVLDGFFAWILDEGKVSSGNEDILIKDLSGGGFLFIYDKQISINTNLMFTIKLTDDTLIYCQGRIMRVKSLDDAYEYGVSFVNLDEASRQKIIQFVYRRQLEVYKKLAKEQP